MAETDMESTTAEDTAEVREMPAYLGPRDGLFRKSRKGKMRLVSSPDPLLEAPVVDTHAHLGMLYDPALTLARCGYLGMDFICAICDPAEDASQTYDNVDAWRSEAFGIIPEVFEASRRALSDHRAYMAQCGTKMPDTFTVDELLANRCSCEGKVPQVRVATGVHPHNAKDYDDAMEQRLLHYLADPRTCALGEVGLDYHYDLSPRDVQRRVFRRQVQLAHMTGLPLVLHMRDAHEDGFRILEEEGWPKAGVLLHCCSVGPQELQRWIDRGCYVAFGGALTFNSSDEIRESAKIVPTNRLVTETDSPFMAPVPFRGIECGPEFTVYVAEYLAALRDVAPGPDRAAFLAQLHDNALALMNRDATGWQYCYDA